MPSDADYAAMALPHCKDPDEARRLQATIDAEIEAERATRPPQPTKRVYLCGGINGLSDADAKDWREEAKRVLNAAGFTPIDPLRHDYRGRENEPGIPTVIVQSDLFDIGYANILLVNAARPSWGTAMEVAIAARYQVYRKQVFAFGAGAKPSPWLVYHCDELFPDLAAALTHIVEKC